jgi:hypothetical protein
MEMRERVRGVPQVPPEGSDAESRVGGQPFQGSVGVHQVNASPSFIAANDWRPHADGSVSARHSGRAVAGELAASRLRGAPTRVDDREPLRPQR